MSTRARRTALALLSAGSLVAVTLVASQSAASEPESSTLRIPGTAGQSVKATYKGTAPPGAFQNSECTVGAPASDEHDLVLEGAADSTATVVFEIAWPFLADTGVVNPNDLLITVVDADGQVLGSADSAEPKETLTLEGLEPGTYTARVCAFAGVSEQAYDGSITVTRPAPPAALPDPGPTVDRGLDFSASLVTDPQRSQGESAAFADRSGVLYSCGTNGASNGTDHGSVSVDGGETWRPLGTPPVGETGTVQGGGDCAIATGQDPNADGKRQLAFIGLGPLTGFSTFTSPDNGRTLQRSPDQNGLEKFNQQSIVDRQWLAFTDDKTVFLNYNTVVGGTQVIQKSTDGGLTYGPQYDAASDGGRLGQIRAIQEGTIAGQAEDIVYFPYSAGNTVKLALSQDGGTTFSQCLAVDAGIPPTAGFVAADHDGAGNLYVTYTEKGAGYDTYLVALPAAKVKDCKGPNPVSDSADNNVDPGFTKKIRVNREGIETTVMPWVAAGGAPGRVAVSYYGTPSVGNPNLGTFKGTWNVYVNQILDPFVAAPQVDQVKATTHPNHYDSICLDGLACTVNNADRSLVDYFTMEHDPATGRLLGVYNQAAKKPDDPQGNIAAPVAIVQRAGPSNKGGSLSTGLSVVSTGRTDKAGDAIPRWTTNDGLLGSPTVGAGGGSDQPALDLRSVRVGPEVDLATGKVVENGGVTVTMTYSDLATPALTAAMQAAPGSSLVYLFRFFDGYQPGGAAAFYEGGTWRFGYNDYTTSVRNPQGNVQTYKGDTPIPGVVDQAAGTIRLSVPRELIEALQGPTGPGQRPEEVKATDGSRVYDASAWTFVNPAPSSRGEQSFLYQSDNTSAFDFLIPATSVAPTPQPSGSASPSSSASPSTSASPSASASASPTGSASPTPTGSASPTPTGSASPTPTGSASPTPTNSPPPGGGSGDGGDPDGDGVVTARSIDDACPADRVPADSRQDDDGSVHEFAIDCMVWWEIAKGTSATRYEPSVPVNRAQMASFVARLIEQSGGQLDDDAPDAFSDDNGLVPHEANINKLAAAGIISGRGDGTYAPGATVSRAQMAKFLVNAYSFRSGNTLAVSGDYFPDDDASVHEDDINRSAGVGFTNGRDGRYEPDAPVRRDQMASFLARALDLLVQEGTTPPKQ